MWTYFVGSTAACFLSACLIIVDQTRFVVAPPSSLCGCNATTTGAAMMMKADGVPKSDASSPAVSAVRDNCLSTCRMACLWTNYTRQVLECYASRYNTGMGALAAISTCKAGTQCLSTCMEQMNAGMMKDGDHSSSSSSTDAGKKPAGSVVVMTMNNQTSSNSSSAVKSQTPDKSIMESNNATSSVTNITTMMAENTMAAAEMPMGAKHDGPADESFLQCVSQQNCCPSLMGCQTPNGTFCDMYTTYYGSLDDCTLPFEEECSKACMVEC